MISKEPAVNVDDLSHNFYNTSRTNDRGCFTSLLWEQFTNFFFLSLTSFADLRVYISVGRSKMCSNSVLLLFVFPRVPRLPSSSLASVCPLQPCYHKARQWLLDNIPSVLVFGVCIGVVQVVISSLS